MGDFDSKFTTTICYSIILLIFTLICFFILTLNFFLIYNLNIEENNPNIMPILYGFSFINTSSYNPEYYESLPNLGYTGKPIYDCYRGECHYYREYECEKVVCKTDADGDKDCETITTTCESYPSSFQYNSSKQCKNNNGEFCNSCSYWKDYTYKKWSCSHVDSDYYSSSFYCNADNLILKWNNYYYKNNSGYINYINRTVPSNQNCPTGTIKCGILDDLGNKLCFPRGISCPINYITLNSSDKNYTYYNYTIGNLTIYYTNEAVNDGKIVGGLYVDSDLMINYNIGECQIITTGKISELLYSHPNKLYRKSLTFNPYKDNDIDKKGKAYLKWCIPAAGKEKNTTLIRELMAHYENNKTINKELIGIKNNCKTQYFISLSGYVLIIFCLIIAILFLRCRKRHLYSLIIILIIIAHILIVTEILISDAFKFSKFDKYNQNFLNAIIRLNIIKIISSIIFVFSFCCFFGNLCDIEKYDYNYNKDGESHENLIDKNTTELKKYNTNSGKSSDSNIFKLTPDSLN